MGSGSPPSSEVPPELAVLWHSTFARRVVRLGRRLRGIDRAHPAALDWLLVVAVLAFGSPELFVLFADSVRIRLGFGGPTVLVAATLVGQAVPLVWRRRSPWGVLAAVLAACVLQWSLGLSLHSAIGLLIALYAVARYDRLTVLPWVAVCSVAGIGVAAFHAEPFRQQAPNSMFFLCSSATAAAALGLVVRVRRAQLDALADRAARLEVEREQRVQLATLAERSRVSREMHDIVGHNLAVIIGLADGAAVDPDARADVLRIIAGTGRQALSELRRTLGALRERHDRPADSAELSPQPGIDDLPALLGRIRAAGPRIHYQTTGNADTVPPSVQLAAYRVVQEALTNSLKHAGRDTRLRVTLRTSDTELGVEVRDSGHPTRLPGNEPAHDVRRTRPRSGHGLIGIEERAALTGGTASAGPTADGGWIVHATLPLSQDPAQREQSS
jgi:signal transduction histidine kinase